ncbi:MAG: hypothetical protein K2L14_05220 [Duncaniella sp.]|nr:hypothetical protein [Duncaniella sp.]
MKKVLSFLLASLVLLTASAGNVVTLVDDSDGSPVTGAAVVSSRGVILGVTDAQGHIVVSEKDFPLSLRSLGYEPLTVEMPADTVAMSPATYALGEVIVTPVDRPVTRVLTYAREYCTGIVKGDTLQVFNEYMLEFFLADEKLKGYDSYDASSSINRVRRYGRIANEDGQDVVLRPDSHDALSSLSFKGLLARIPSFPVKVSGRIKEGAACDTVAGKHFPKYVFRNFNDMFIVEHDQLADKKKHVWSPMFFKMLGCTMEISDYVESHAFHRNDSSTYGLKDYIFTTSTLHVLVKGKWMKKIMDTDRPYEVDCYLEQYPVEITHLTVDEYKEMKKNRIRHEPFRMPDIVQPLPAAVERLVERVEEEERR